MAGAALLLWGPWTHRQLSGLLIGTGAFFLGIGFLLLLGHPGLVSVLLYVGLAIAVFGLGAVLAGVGVILFRRAPPPPGPPAH